MKIFNYIVSAAFGTLAMTSCTDLSEKLYDRWHQRTIIIPRTMWSEPHSVL